MASKNIVEELGVWRFVMLIEDEKDCAETKENVMLTENLSYKLCGLRLGDSLLNA